MLSDKQVIDAINKFETDKTYTLPYICDELRYLNELGLIEFNFHRFSGTTIGCNLSEAGKLLNRLKDIK